MLRITAIVVGGFFLSRCIGPMALTTAPVSPVNHVDDEGLTGFGGLRVGYPTALEDFSRPIIGVSGHIGLAGQWEYLSVEASGWPSFGRYFVPLNVVDNEGFYLNTFGFQIQSSGALSPRLGNNFRLDLGATVGSGFESWFWDDRYTLDTSRFSISGGSGLLFVPMLAPFLGFRATVAPDNTIGFRWHPIGLGTGMSLSYRYRSFQGSLGTQVFPLVGGVSNWTLALLYFFPNRR